MVSNWLTYIPLAWICLAFISLVIILFDIYALKPRQQMWMEPVWAINALYFRPLGVWAYYKWGRLMTADADPDKDNRPYWSKVAVGVMHCGAGCTLGDIIAESGVFLAIVIFGSKFATDTFDFLLAFGRGILFQYFSIAPMRGLELRDGMTAALKADFLSLTALTL